MAIAPSAALLQRPSVLRPGDRPAAVALEIQEHGPEFTPEFVRRPRLAQRLANAAAPLALIVAPPGFGKSTLLADWAQTDERPFLWLGPAVPGDPAPDLDVVISGRRCVVVLDNADLLSGEQLRALSERVLAVLAPGSMLALASRAEPELPTGRLRAHKAVHEVRMRDLALTPAETATLLQNAGFECEEETVQGLADRTAGWPVALYLAALSARNDFEAPAGLAHFGGDDHLLCEYLRDEVFSALPPAVLAFLVRTSIIDRLSAPVCDAVLKDHQSARLLARAARATQLLEPQDPAHTSYRCHPLFRETLVRELRGLDPALERELRLRASAWYREQGDSDRAIEHACHARDVARAGELLWERLAIYTTTGRARLVREWLANFSAGRAADDARLAVCAAHGCLADGDSEGARYWTAAASAATERSETDTCPTIKAGIALVDAAVARGGVAGMRQAADFARKSLDDGSPWRPMSCALSGIAAHLSGDRQTAAELLQQASELGGEWTPGITALCLSQRGMIAIEEQDWELAAEVSDRAVEMIAGCDLAGDPLAGLPLSCAAASQAHEGRIDEAKRNLRDALNLLASFPDTAAWYGAEQRVLLAHASLWLADVVGARTLLAQASRLARRVPDAPMFAHWFDDAWSYLDTVAESSLSGPSALTIAELRILRFLPSHRSFREIAVQLGVSANTVKTQAHAVYRKLGAASRSEAVERARDAGILLGP